MKKTLAVFAAMLIASAAFAQGRRVRPVDVASKEATVTEMTTRVMRLLMKKTPHPDGDTLMHLRDDGSQLVLLKIKRAYCLQFASKDSRGWILDYGADGWHPSAQRGTPSWDGIAGPNAERAAYEDWSLSERMTHLDMYLSELMFWEKKLRHS